MKIMLDKIKKIKYNRMSTFEKYIIDVFNDVVIVESSNKLKYFYDNELIIVYDMNTKYFHMSMEFGNKIYKLENNNIRLETVLQKLINEILHINVVGNMYFTSKLEKIK